MGQADDGQGCRDVLGAFGLGEVGEQQRQFDVALGCEHRHEVVELENEANVAGAPGGERAVGELVNPLARRR